MVTDGSQQCRRDGIKQGPNLIVTRKLSEAKEGVGITLPFVGGHSTLIGQERRTLGEERGKGTQGGIAHGVVFVFAFAGIGKRCRRSTQGVKKLCEWRRFAPLESSCSSGVPTSLPQCLQKGNLHNENGWGRVAKNQWYMDFWMRREMSEPG